MRVFVAGAAGAIGRQLVPMLIEAGHEVTGTTRSAERAAWLRSQGAHRGRPGRDGCRRAQGGCRRRPPARRGPSADRPRGGFRCRTAPCERAPSPGRNAQPHGRDPGSRSGPHGCAKRRVAVRAGSRAARGGRPAPRPDDRPRSPRLARDHRTGADRHLDARRRRAGVALRLPLRTGTEGTDPGDGPTVHVVAAADAAARAVDRGSPGIYNIVDDGGSVNNARAREELGWRPGRR